MDTLPADGRLTFRFAELIYMTCKPTKHIKPLLYSKLSASVAAGISTFLVRNESKQLKKTTSSRTHESAENKPKSHDQINIQVVT